MAPQIIYLILIFANLLLVANKHGKERKGKYNIWESMFTLTLQTLLFWWGGFFDVFFR